MSVKKALFGFLLLGTLLVVYLNSPYSQSTFSEIEADETSSVFRTRVIGKNIKKVPQNIGGITYSNNEYYITIQNGDKIEVTQNQYDSLRLGEQVLIEEKNGVFKVI